MAVDSMLDRHLYSLPNELFVLILSPFSTHELLSVARVSHRFHALVLRLLHYRLLLSASVAEYNFVLECFHPASRLTEPNVFCKYLGTPGLSDKYEGEGSLYENVNTAGQLGRLCSLYSVFKPVETEEEMSDISSNSSDSGASAEDSLAVRRPVAIEGFEDFSQLCVVVNLVKSVPGTGILLSAVNIEDGVIRLFRDWLKNQANCLHYLGRQDEHPGNQGSGFLWADRTETVGLKFRVQEATMPGSDSPLLVPQDEESFSSYEVTIDAAYSYITFALGGGTVTL